MRIQDHVADAAIAKIASNTTYAGAATAVGGWLTMSNIGVLVGILMAVAGYVTNAVYRRRELELHRSMAHAENARKAELHAARLEHLRNSSRYPAIIDEDD